MTYPDDLKSIGLKATYPRLKILDLFHKLQDEGAPRHVTAEDVYRHLLADGLDIGLATVYRVLTQFEQGRPAAAPPFRIGQGDLRTQRRKSSRPPGLRRMRPG
jgi:Fur family ferric uptake transcriptional regulator